MYGVQHLWFGDDVFALNHHWVQEFADEIEAMCALPFKIQSRADLMTNATVDALNRAGCAEDMDGRGVRVTEGPRRYGQGPARLRCCHCARASGRRRYPCMLLPPIWLSGRDLGGHSTDHSAGPKYTARRYWSLVFISAARHRFYERVGTDSGLSAIGRTATTYASCLRRPTPMNFTCAFVNALHAEVDSWRGRTVIRSSRCRLPVEEGHRA